MGRTNTEILTALLVLILLTGCASAPQQAFDEGQVAKVRIIGLLDVQEPAEYSAVNMGGAAFMLGVVGGVAQNQSNEAQSGKFTAVVRPHFNAARRMEQQLTEKLQAKGYQVVSLAGQRPVLKGDKPDYSGIQSHADVFLEVGFFSVGYLSEPNALSYNPSIKGAGRVISRELGARLYFQSFAYGEKWGTPKGMELLPAPAGSSLRSFDALVGNPELVAASLQAGVDAMATRIADAFP